MQVGDTVMARNKMGGPTVLASDPRATHEVRWEGRGDPSGGDVQYIPDEMLRIPAFARALKLGIIEIVNPEENSELVEALEKQAAKFHTAQAQAQDEVMATIDHEKTRDLITQSCIGPSTRGTGECGEQVPVHETKQHDAPPLCSRHVSLAPEFVPVNEGQDERENKKVRWIRGIMSPTPIGHQA